MKVISVRENPEYKDRAIAYLQQVWEEVPPIVYEDCVYHCIGSKSNLPQWYLLENDGEIAGCAGLVPNDFISRMDLYPWVCAVFVDERYRGHAYGALLLEKAKQDTKKAGFNQLYLCTDHIGYYEKYGFSYVGQGYHPWEEESRIYGIEV
ncbi:GNAT superfamily N-acetyltransferase [Pedobacter cryoconitis]|uniref:GNAT superfamily N-acetyltransferase n=1 Tax=Pedobacter cryoconitis TaxID=188932 RepID=A0A7W8ZNN0_9SPHI|nr:GNAT family N-acetyltransferase [Pedobacter cryoconitis]MBB5637127.1 GNAT superfamily N-acetyltransferase [Pedobacter cryoconitis]MBB6273894.1 GNAT superfamily N-acetyltransferase [Pedobacter cryoconitis]